MIPASVVIITKNEAHIITKTLQAACRLTDDVVVIDSGSTDATPEIARAAGARLIQTTWAGFGPNKNMGINAARYNWILSLDADELPDEELIASLHAVDYENTGTVYNIRFKTFLGSRQIRYGEWGNDSHIRFFNRTHTKWNDATVHEQLIISPNTPVKTLKGHVLHYTMKDIAEYATKMTQYALLNAENYFRKGKSATWLKRNVSPSFAFIQNYFFKLGFLDGSEGYLAARITAFYTLVKYARLHELNKTKNK